MAGMGNAVAGYKRFTVDAMRGNALRVALCCANVNGCSAAGRIISTTVERWYAARPTLTACADSYFARDTFPVRSHKEVHHGFPDTE